MAALSEHPESRLLSLPFELRAQIWGTYFGRRIFDLQLYYRRRVMNGSSAKRSDIVRLTDVENEQLKPGLHREENLLYIGRLKLKSPSCFYHFYEFIGSDSRSEWLPLLRTNRQIYEEATQVLFEKRIWIIGESEMPVDFYCECDHSVRKCTNQHYHSVHLAMRSHMPLLGDASYRCYSMMFLPLIKLRTFWNIHIEIELNDQRDTHLIDWICRTLSRTVSATYIHAVNTTTIAMQYVDQDVAAEYRTECWPGRHKREFMDATWMRFQQPGLAIVGATYASQKEREAGWCYATLKERAPFMLISPLAKLRGSGAATIITRIAVRETRDLFQDRSHTSYTD